MRESLRGLLNEAEPLAARHRLKHVATRLPRQSPTPIFSAATAGGIAISSYLQRRREDTANDPNS
jgi:hypothetical protein